ncbi:hypothetical protein TNCT_505781 [Trichonephila clavata]|uniref:Uncharacterized protein n=1 Tax=Trichonephila clavata TaxID=2740835 RepID=A0A8X6JPU7_TRICU|nr:hypothetical protein TNCT_505781 [Trichonephila clavata]
MSSVTVVSSVEYKSSPESPVSVRHEELLQPTEDLSGPDKSSLGHRPNELRTRHQFSGRQEQFRRRRVQPYQRRSKRAAHEGVHIEQGNPGIEDKLENRPTALPPAGDRKIQRCYAETHRKESKEVWSDCIVSFFPY